MAHTRTSSTFRSAGAEPSKAAGGLRFWAAGYTLLILLIGTNLPTPLYHGYQLKFGFSALTVTLIFAVYVAVLIPSLLVAGPLSDAVGRRRVLVPAVALAVLGSVAFALAQNVVWLFAARILQGVALGAASGPLTAALNELEPNGDRRRASLVSTIASVGGLGTGPLLAGLLAQYFPAPRVTPFGLEIVLLIPAAVTVALLPATTVTARWRPRRPEIPVAMRGIFATSGSAGFLAFAVVGLALTLVPTYVATLSGSRNLLLGGAAVASVLACSAVAQVLGYGRSARALQLSGLPLVAVGLILLAVAGSVSSLTLLLVATVTAGVGHGLVFLGGLTAVNHAAPAGRHAEVASTFLVVLYLGTGVPAVGVGFLATVSGLLRAVQVFAVGVAVLCLIVLVVLVRRRASGAEIAPAAS
ncbi:MFS transporter [Nocardia aurantia]|uniref:Major facilitator superfamily (MFS) profile domain-containing protein n=1 Tax=Nocardia aurantia TaxID=2585199 RepID=A0A7K0DYU3_9NOCA|nr:MFS transporter [Nocardia aurantia]MQY30861.1 hypothetical protein [Nocardia aurantia]